MSEPVADEQEHAPAPAARTKRRWTDLRLYAATVTVTYAWLFWVLELWRFDFRHPLEWGGDASFHGMLYNAIDERGWHLVNPRLGAPFGQHLADFPVADNLHLVFGKVLSVFFDSWVDITNLYFLATFGLTAAAALWALRHLGVSRPAAAVLAVLYALAPYHFARWLGHLFLAAYWPVPLAVVALVTALRGERLWRDEPGLPLWRRVLTWPLARLVLICVVVGSASSYYAVFAVVLALAAGVLALLRGRQWTAGVPAALIVVVILGTLVVNAAPTFLYRQEHGTNEVAARRFPYETEAYSLKLGHMLLPIEHHRVGALAELRDRYRDEFPVPSEGKAAALGLVGAVGLLWLLIVPVLVLGGATRIVGSAVHHELSALTLVGFLTATTGGVSTLTSFSFTTQIRAWNRMSIVLLFLALGAVGLLLDRLWGSVRRRRFGNLAMAAVLVGVMTVGVVDQTSDGYIRSYEVIEESYDHDRAFFGAIEDRLPAKAMVFQLPVAPFPEAGPIAAMGDYEHLKAYLLTDDVRWSYGAVKGRPDSDWQLEMGGWGADELAPALAAAGFDGIYVDRLGYGDNGKAIVDALAQRLGEEPFESENDRMVFFPLASYAASLWDRVGETEVADVRERVLYPPFLDLGSGISEVPPPTSVREWWVADKAEMTVLNPGRRDRQVDLRFKLATIGPSVDTEVVLPDGQRQPVSVSEAVTDVHLTFTAKPGRNVVRLASKAGDGVDIGSTLRLSGESADDEGLTPLLRSLA